MDLLEMRLVRGKLVEKPPRLDFDPALPTDARPGSSTKVKLLEARYLMGLPLWVSGDRVDHGEHLTPQEVRVWEFAFHEPLD